MIRSTATTDTSVERECLRAAALVALGAAAAVVMLWANSFPGWPLAAGVVLSVLVLGGLLVIIGSEPQPAARWLRPIGLLAALVVAVGGGVIIHQIDDVALRVRFAHSRPDFDAVVASAGSPPLSTTQTWESFPSDCPERIGSYRIDECRAFTGGFLFLQQRDALAAEAGFAYAPYGLLTTEEGGNGLSGSEFTPIEGFWYAWTAAAE